MIDNTYGFIILRHVRNFKDNQMWISCYNSIRKFYSNKIIIIDDNSNKEALIEILLINCEIINSEFKQRGELLPYYYFHKFKFFENAVILHDSMFIGQKLNFELNKVKFLWFVYSHRWNNSLLETDLISKLKNKDKLLKIYRKKKLWYPCYGNTSIINIKFLESIQKEYNIFNLLSYVDNREKRMCTERIFGLIFFIKAKLKRKTCSYLGKIHDFPRNTFKSNAYNYQKYIKDEKDFYPIIKIWVGR